MKPEQLEQMTIQEACDYAVKQIVKQGYQCRDGDNGDCAYSDGQGGHCVIGWLMDESNSDMMDYIGEVDDFIDCFEDGLPLVILNNVEILKNLQGFHDSEGKEARAAFKSFLSWSQVDTTGAHWQQWIEMGE